MLENSTNFIEESLTTVAKVRRVVLQTHPDAHSQDQQEVDDNDRDVGWIVDDHRAIGCWDGAGAERCRDGAAVHGRFAVLAATRAW